MWADFLLRSYMRVHVRVCYVWQMEVAKCIEQLCVAVPDIIHLQMAVLVTALYANLGHQRSPVRL